LEQASCHAWAIGIYPCGYEWVIASTARRTKGRARKPVVLTGLSGGHPILAIEIYRRFGRASIRLVGCNRERGLL